MVWKEGRGERPEGCVRVLGESEELEMSGNVQLS